MLGMAPMPICRVAPSAMVPQASSAMARSTASAGASARAKGWLSDSTSTSMRSTGRVLVYSGGSEEVRGKLRLVSMTSSRSGSCPASTSSS